MTRGVFPLLICLAVLAGCEAAEIGEASKVGLLKDYVRKQAREATSLQPSVPAGSYPRDRDWKLIVNTDIEPET